MNFYNEPTFWAFLGTTFSGLFGLLKLHFVYLHRADENKARLDASIERIRSDNITKSLDFLNKALSEIKPMVLRHEVLMKDLENSTKMVGMIEKEMTKQFANVSHQYEDFQRKLTNITISFQTTIDRVDAFDKKLSALGKVTVKP